MGLSRTTAFAAVRSHPDRFRAGQLLCFVDSLTEEELSSIAAITDASDTATICGCLSSRLDARSSSAGLKGSFHSSAGWEFLLCSGVLEIKEPDLEGVSQSLWNAGFTHPEQVAKHRDKTTLADIINQPESTASHILAICRQYAYMLTRHEILCEVPRRVAMSTVASSSQQSDKDKNAHPASVELWESCAAEALAHVNSMPAAPYTFPPASSSSSKGGTSEASCEAAFMRAACEGVNRVLRYEADKGGVRGPQWQRQSRKTVTDSQRKELEQVSQDQAVKLAVGQASRSVPDLELKCTTPERQAVSLVEMKRAERLGVVVKVGCKVDHDGMEGPRSRISGGEGDEGMEVAAPDIVAIWNKRATNVPAKLQHNVVGVISQVLRYCASQGIKYAMFSCWWFTWAVQLEGNALKLTHFISHKAISASLAGSATWQPLTKYPYAQPAGTTGRGAPSQEDSTARAPPGPDGGHTAGSQGQEGTAHGMPGTSAGTGTRRCLQEDQDQQGSSCSGLVCSTQAAQAASIDLQRVEGLVGSGSTGDVFAIRLRDGLAALKVAPLDSWEAASLSNEGEVLTRLEPLWDRVVPGLLACGPDGDDEAYFLATRLVTACRHLDPASDAQLLPKLQDALQAVHDMGVVHGDLRRENILVEEGKGGEATRVWLVDFGLARLVGTREQQEEEMRGLRVLVGAR